MDNRRLEELEAKLEIYKSTLTEIYERYDQKLEELSLVRRVGDALRTTLTVESLASALMATVAHEVVADRLALILKDPPDEAQSPLKLRAAYFADREEFEYYRGSQETPFRLEPLGLWNQGEPLRPQTVFEVPSFLDPLCQEPDESPRTILAAPFLVRDRFLGLLLLSRPFDQPFSKENEHMLSIMADQASAALSNVQLFDDLNRINTKLSLSERRARESSQYLERLLETANDAIMTVDVRGLITYANRKAAQWGWSKNELLGREFRLFLEQDPSLVNWPVGGPPPADAILEAMLINQAGEKRTVLISTSNVGAEEHGTSGAAIVYQTATGQSSPTPSGGAWMLMVSDLTERRQLERQLLHSEKLASIGLLAAGVAHEVGNPLSAISGYAQILEAGVDSETEHREYLQAILNQTGRIQKILRELLDYSRPARGLAEKLDLADHLLIIMGMLEGQRSFSRMRVVYDFAVDSGPFMVTVDRDHLAQVVVIIAMNAAQAMERQTEPEATFTLSLWREAGQVLMRLADNGPGMSPLVRKRVFDPFFTTKGPGQGTGLGLAICQRIVESYHGRMDLETAEGQGAAFTIVWPGED
ncbi:MAG: PAS domain S-box protein [Deltaproteobacteria bacterium]|jgi:signal transduction histidine kinase|nr:PAS domain S-box protein [Deltaproteobacteria bacterium]